MKKTALALVLLTTPALADNADRLAMILGDRTLALCGWELDPAQAGDMLAHRTVAIEQLAREVCQRAAKLRKQVPLEGKFLR